MTTDEQPETEILPLPLDDWHREQGARMVAFAGYHMPIQYEGIMAEHLWTRENAGLFDVSHMGQLVLTGDDVAAALETIVPGDIAVLQPGKMRYSLLLAEDGGILDDLMVSRFDYDNSFVDNTGLYLVVNGATKHDDIGYLHEALPETVGINYLDDRALIALQGPKAVDALERVVPGVSALVFMTAGAFPWVGQSAISDSETNDILWISRSGYTGEDGFEISIPGDQARAFADRLLAQPEVKPIGLGARDSLRLEAGLPLYGHDLDDTVDPVEADLTFAINKRRREQGGFAGADRILGALAAGPARKRVGLSVAGKMPVREGAPLFAGGMPVGTVTSGGFAPSLQAPIAMGYVETVFADPGTTLEAEVRGKRIPVTIAPMPFIPHRYHRKGAAK